MIRGFSRVFCISAILLAVSGSAQAAVVGMDPVETHPGQPIHQQFLDSGASVVTTAAGRTCMVSRRIGIEVSDYRDSAGAAVPFTDIRRSPATSVQAGDGGDGAVWYRLQMKYPIDRARPYETMSDVHLLVSRTTDFSFPSDHATVAGAVAAGLFLANRRWGIVAIVAALLMAVTRVYVGAHYPADVVAGLALGALTAVCGWLVVVPLIRRMLDRLATTGIHPLLTAAPAASATSSSTPARPARRTGRRRVRSSAGGSDR